eukprot:scaffold15108_cov180-Amphora_coffeaeformis.AAC.70
MAITVKMAPAVNETNCHRRVNNLVTMADTRLTKGAGSFSTKACHSFSTACQKASHFCSTVVRGDRADKDEDDSLFLVSSSSSSTDSLPRNDDKKRLWDFKLPHFRTLPRNKSTN